MATTNSNASASERNSVSKTVYVNAKGEATKSPTAESIIVRTTFADKSVHDMEVAKLPDAVKVQALLQGISIKLQRSFASAKGNVADAIEMFSTVKENLENGIWATKREGSGPRLSILFEAVCAALEEAKQTVDDARKVSIMEKLKQEEYREKAMKDVKVVAHYDRIKLERAKAKAAESAKNAKSAESTIASDF